MRGISCREVRENRKHHCFHRLYVSAYPPQNPPSLRFSRTFLWFHCGSFALRIVLIAFFSQYRSKHCGSFVPGTTSIAVPSH